MDLADREVRRKLVKQQARRLRLRLPRRLVQRIADEPQLTDLESIERFMVRLKVFASGQRRKVTPELIDEVLLPVGVLVDREVAARGVPTIFSAIEDGDAEEVADLLRGGVDLEVTASHQEGMTPLLLALYQRDAGIARLLLEAGADPHNRGDYSSPPVHLAARNSSCLALLIEAGADVDARDDQGRTPLMHLATHDRHAERVSTLLAAGADPTLRDSRGRQARDLAAANGADRVLHLLEDAELNATPR